MLQVKTAINYRTREEGELIKKLAEQQSIDTSWFSIGHKGRAYICPERYSSTAPRAHIENWTDPDEHCSVDEHDPFKWNYLEASVVFRNLLIAERKKNVT